MKKRLCAAVCACVMLLGGVTACKKTPQKFSAYSFDYFDTQTVITGYADCQEDFDTVADAILEQLGEYHRLYNVYLRYEGMENLCTINELVDGAHRTVTVDRRIIDLLLYAKEMYRQTDGVMNVAMGSVLKLWHDHRAVGTDSPADATLPPMERLKEAAQHTDIDRMVIDEAACTVTLTDPAMRLDVGAIAKGYAVERVARRMEQDGITGYVLNVGGNVRTVGARDDGEPWTAGIENPDGNADDPYFALVSLAGESLVTSGSYQRYYVVDGKPYHHIIDPETLMPSEGFVSVSVLTKSSADGDALSTALFCMSEEDGLALVESLEGVEALWVLSDGTRVESSGFSAYTK